MVKDSNMQKTIVISKELNEKIKEEAREKEVSTNWVIRKILTDYYREKENG